MKSPWEVIADEVAVEHRTESPGAVAAVLLQPAERLLDVPQDPIGHVHSDAGGCESGLDHLLNQSRGQGVGSPGARAYSATPCAEMSRFSVAALGRCSPQSSCRPRTAYGDEIPGTLEAGRLCRITMAADHRSYHRDCVTTADRPADSAGPSRQSADSSAADRWS
jgi:hypothetical protein